jgi:hypothetical protein
MLYVSGLSTRDLSEKRCITYASRENVRRMVLRALEAEDKKILQQYSS